MLHYFFAPLAAEHGGIYNLFTYISFRAVGAAVTALLISFIVGPMIVASLKRRAAHQVVREGTPDTHAIKGTTPTMGGIIIIVAAVIPTLLWARMSTSRPFVYIAIGVTLWMGIIGLIDDLLKLKQKREGRENRGLVEAHKLIGQVSMGIFLGWWLWHHPISPLPGASTTLPFFKYVLIVPATFALGWLYVAFTTFIIVGTSNAVNIADGLDGLAAGLSAIAFTTFAVFAYAIGRVDFSRYLGLFHMPGAGELTIFCAAMIGALIGFLWFNTFPAQVFMGDTGSLALGGALGAVAVLMKTEFLLAFVGAVFVAEMLSVITQRFVFKYRKARYGLEYAKANRVLLRAPLNHHYEMKGWSEVQVVVRFWIVGILSALFALTTLKIR